jgi:sodium/potassium-transporting ATPase subunit alpha
MFLGIVIVLIVLVTGVLSYYQNSKSEAIMESIKQLSKLQVIVVRQPKQGTNKEEQTVNSSEIVPGDVVIIKSGQKIPADIRIIKSTNLQIDNSSLTVHT